MSNHPVQVPPYIRSRISEGEHQRLDFKFTVNDSRKIAITLSAFANTDGGTLLIGVKDNGVVAGINLEEETHMLEAAAGLYCVPPVEFSTQAWRANNRYVLEVIVPPSPYKPHHAIDEEGTPTAYLRDGDKNYPAPGVMLEYWRTMEDDLPGRYFHTDKERKLFELLTEERGHTVSELSRKSLIPRKVVTRLLARFMRWELVEMSFDQGQARFSAVSSM